MRTPPLKLIQIVFFALLCGLVIDGIAMPTAAETLHSFANMQFVHHKRMFGSFSRYQYGSVLAATPTAVSFGSIQTGNSTSSYVNVKNNGSVTVYISKATVSGSGFSMSGLTVPTSLSPGHSITFTARFAPASAGSVSGNIQIVSSRTTTNIALSGTGTASGKLSLSPSSLSFGSVPVGSSKSLTTTVTASGSNVVISSAGTSSGEVVLSGGPLPATIGAGKSAQVTVTFKPQSSGTATGTFSFSSNASNPTLTGSFSGTGTTTSAPAPKHSVSLTWSESSSGIAGYNVYRGTASAGPYSKINSGMASTPSFTDTSVSAGKTYFYVATAVTGSGTESKYSNPITVTVPTP